MSRSSIQDHDTEPLDPAARVITGGYEWARRTHPEDKGRWAPIGATGSYGWWALRHLFPDAVVVLPALPAGRTIPARNSDPATSKRATGEIRVRAGSQRARLLAAFGRYGTGEPYAAPTRDEPGRVAAQDGLTDEEAARLADGVSPASEYAKRCSELRDGRLIEPTGETRKGASGQDRIVSRITDEGRRVLASLNT